MIRHLLPRFDWSGWGGASLTDPSGRTEWIDGWCLCIQWLGLMIEIGAGRVSKS